MFSVNDVQFVRVLNRGKTLTICMGFFLTFLFALQPYCSGQGIEKEASAVRMIKLLRGRVKQDGDGRTTMVILGGIGKLTDAQIEAIDFSALRYLTNLTLVDRNVTDKSLAHLGPMPSLKGIELKIPKSSSDGLLKFLKGCKSRDSIILKEMPMTDEIAAEIAKHKDLAFLSLIDMNVSDKNMKVIAKIPALASLDLPNTDLTDAAIIEIAKMKTLRFLDLRGTKVTETGKKTLQKLLPALKVVD